VGKLQKMSEEHENIIQHVQMQILDDLGFSRCAVPLHVLAVIFRKRILTESRTYWISEHRHLEQYTTLVDFQAEELQSIYVS